MPALASCRISTKSTPALRSSSISTRTSPPGNPNAFLMPASAIASATAAAVVVAIVQEYTGSVRNCHRLAVYGLWTLAKETFMKRLVICADGTWNTRDQMNDERKKRRPTNVTKVARGVRPRDGNGVDQIVFYHDG